MKTIHLGELAIPIEDYASQGNGILGIRDSGKSYTATFFAEQLLNADIPFVAFDPIGVWRYLKVPGRGAGYKVVVAGGENGDLPLTPESAPEIVRAAMRENIPLVLDLYSMEMSKADWRRIVESCIRLLLYENKSHGLRHVFIEEAAEFAPQRIGPESGKVYAEIEKLVRMGGNAMLGYTLINQRAEEVNKAVLELCDCLFLHRQKGKNSLTSLGKWLDFAGSKEKSKEIVGTLPMLPQGDCWVWPAGTETPIRVHIPEKRSFHPNRRQKTDMSSKPASDVTSFVATLKQDIQVKAEERETMERLRRRVRELEDAQSNGATLVSDFTMPEPVTIEVPVFAPGEFEKVEDMESRLIALSRELPELVEMLQRVCNSDGAAHKHPNRLHEVLTHKPNATRAVAATAARPRVENKAPKPAGTGGGATGPAGSAAPLQPVAQRILNALAELEQLGAKTPKRQLLAIFSGYTHVGSTGFVKALGSLSSNGYVEYPGSGLVALTALGWSQANAPERPRTAREVQKRVCEMIGGKSSEILQSIIAAYPSDISREDVMRAAGYSHIGSTGFVKALGRLSSLGFVTYPDKGRVKASPVLFLKQ